MKWSRRMLDISIQQKPTIKSIEKKKSLNGWLCSFCFWLNISENSWIDTFWMELQVCLVYPIKLVKVKLLKSQINVKDSIDGLVAHFIWCSNWFPFAALNFMNRGGISNRFYFIFCWHSSFSILLTAFNAIFIDLKGKWRTLKFQNYVLCARLEHLCFFHFVFIGMLIDEIALKFNHKNGIPIASVAKSGRKKSGKKSAARFITESANVKIQYILHDILLWWYSVLPSNAHIRHRHASTNYAMALKRRL